MRIREIRMQKSISQRELAKALEIAPNTLSQYETEKRQPDKETLLRIADFLDVSLDYLFGREEKTPTPVAEDGLALDKRLVERLIQLSPEEQEKVEAFVQGMIAGRGTNETR